MQQYARGSYNKFNDTEQWIRVSEGCPNNCEFCRETKECGTEPIYFEIPHIVRNKVKILDMNLLCKPEAIMILYTLGSKRVNKRTIHYELTCGIDWRYMTQEKANALKKNRFRNIRFAWDHKLNNQYGLRDCFKMLLKAGYRPRDLMVFIICDWKITFSECLLKLFLLKSWGVKVSDCWFDNVIPPNYQCNYWTLEQCKLFRALCSIHNQSINYGIYPDLKRAERSLSMIDKGLR